MTRRIPLRLATLLALLLAGSPAGAGNPDLVWRQIETEHFIIVYHQGLEELAGRAATISEDAHRLLAAAFGFSPSGKVHVVVTDTADTANGFASAYQYPLVHLYGHPPEDDSALNTYSDWLRTLIVHEYVHIFHLSDTSGLPALLNRIFGTFLNPNLYQAGWFVEGIATYEESRLAAGGRLRSAIYDMYLRTDIYNGRFLRLDQMSGAYSGWPYGAVRYVYGSSFLAFLADRLPDGSLAAVSRLYGERLVPYGMNLVLRRAAGVDYLQMYAEWRAFLETKYALQRESILRSPLSSPRLLTERGIYNRPLDAGPDGVLWYRSDHQTTSDLIELVEPSGVRVAFSAGVTGFGGARRCGPDRIVAAQKVPYRNTYRYHDLFLIDIRNGTVRRLTEGARATEPVCSPDGRSVWFVRSGAGRSRLAVLDVETGQPEQVELPIPFDQIFHPDLSPDGQRVVFSAIRTGGSKDLWLYDRETKAVTRLTDDTAIELQPRFSADGGRIIFSSDADGVYNIYSLDPRDGRTVRQTNLVSGGFTPVEDGAGGIYLSLFSGEGYDVALVEPLERPVRPVGRGEGAGLPGGSEPPPVRQVESAYNPFPSLLPKVWLPTWGSDHAGSTLGVHTWGGDSAGRHSYDIEVDFGLRSGRVTAGVSYTNDSFTPTIGASFANSYAVLAGGAVVNGRRTDFAERSLSGSLSVSLPISEPVYAGPSTATHAMGLSFGWSYRLVTGENDFAFDPGMPAPQLPETGRQSSLSLSWYYSNRLADYDSIGFVRGRALSLSLYINSHLLGSDYESLFVRGSWKEYFKIPLLDSHTLALSLSGGLGVTEYAYRKLFYLGGYPSSSLVSNILFRERVYGSFLRGYRSYAMGGNRFLLLQAEYRLPLFDVNRGLYLFPIYLSRVHLGLFYDGGQAFDGAFDPGSLRHAAGFELRFDLLAGYWEPLTLRAGFAHGFSTGGLNTFFLALDNLF